MGSEPETHARLLDRMSGILLGTAAGDALGLPFEGMRPSRIARLAALPLRHRFIARRGMISDDTEHTLFVSQALLEDSKHDAAFRRRLAWMFRWWILGLPAGIGLATLRSCVKLWMGVSPLKSGVYSAGNGPSMRAAVIGGYFHDDLDAMECFVRASTELTHTDPRANTGALAVARMAGWSLSRPSEKLPSFSDISQMLTSIASQDDEWQDVVEEIEKAAIGGLSVPSFAKSLNLEKGVTGYVYHTVPVALYAWLRHYGNFRETLESVVSSGGDTDTVAAIAGALAGAAVGEDGIPQEWLEGICDWPRSVWLLKRVSERLSEQKGSSDSLGAVPYFWPGVLPRNLFFMVIVLAHGFRRLLPPY